MTDCLIVLVNRSCARFFILEEVDFPELESGPVLTQCLTLENTEYMTSSQDMYTDSKTGRGSRPLGRGVHGYGDKREQHLDELARRFAANVLERLRSLAGRYGVKTIVLASSARMRRFVYPGAEQLARRGVHIEKVSKNMIPFSLQKIQEYLAEAGLVPEKKRSTV